MSGDAVWFVYMVRSADGRLYTGVTTDTERRLNEHRQAGTKPKTRGAKYFRGRTGLQMVFKKSVANRSTAQKLEYMIKQLEKPRKEALVQGAVSLEQLFPDEDE
jgi:putative endonuclease